MDGWMSLSLHPCQHVLSDVVLILDSDYGKMRSQSSFALQYSDDWNVEHIFKCFSANCVSSFENSLLGSAPHFLFGFFSWFSVILVLYFRYQSSIKCIIDKSLLQALQAAAFPNDIYALCHTQAFQLHEVPFIISGLSTCAISVLLRKSFPVTIGSSIFPSFILSDSGCRVLYRALSTDLIYSTCTHAAYPAPIVEDVFFSQCVFSAFLSKSDEQKCV